MREVSSLGDVISRGDMVVNPSKVDVVLQWEAPKSVVEIRCFLGPAGYYRRFIKDFSTLDLLLTQLTRKGQTYG